MRANVKIIGLAFTLMSAPALSQPSGTAYPASYGKLIEASKRESGLLVYSNVAEYNWRPILAGFKRKYPWIKVATLDMGPNQLFERYNAETSAKRRTVDLIVVAAPDAWRQFHAKGQIVQYASPEGAALPAWSKPARGLYTFSTDPMILVYNKLLLKPNEYPKGIAQLATMASANPKRFRNKLTTYDAGSHSFAYAIHWTVVNQRKPGGWELMAKLGPLTRPEAGGATMLDKVTSGEYMIAYYGSGVTVFPHMKERGRDRVVGWALPSDGTPVMMRGIAVTKAARSPSSAKLLLDYSLSRQGQLAAARGGLTPYRPDIGPRDVPYLTYAGIVRRVGPRNVVLINYDRRMLTEYRPFVQRWNKLFKHN